MDFRVSLGIFAAVTLCIAFQKVCLCAISVFVMADLQEKHISFKFCLKLGETAAETHRSAVGRTWSLQTFGWSSRFKLVQPSVAGCLRCFDCYLHFWQEFVGPGQTVSWHYYREILQRLREHVLRKLLEKWRNRNCLAYGDNAQTHTALLEQQFLSTKYMAVAHPTLLTHVIWPLRFLPPGVVS